MDYFNLLNLPRQYQIDSKQLKEHYYAMQSKHHPDKAKSEEDKQKSLKISAAINNAYSILKDDIARARHLLELQNIKCDEQSMKEILDSKKLEIIWQEQEELENINSQKKLITFHKIKTLEQKSLMQNLAEYLNHNNLHEALDVLTRLQYLTGLIDKCEFKLKNASN